MLYHIDSQNRLFVHAGFDTKLPFEGQQESTYYFDRDLWKGAIEIAHSRDVAEEVIGGFNEILIGHTATTYWQTDLPMKALNITNLDTGAGHEGKLTIMDVDTRDYWQSDGLALLYSGA